MAVDKIFQDADFYDPSLDYPGFESDDDVVEVIPSATPRGCFRLVVQSSDVLARRKRLAVLDAYTQTEIGRDLSTSETDPRIRLKDMEVSKVHATIFWEEARAGWAIVDMGSKHGTFITPSRLRARRQHATDGGESSSSSLPASIRLSPPKQASLPRALTHGDLITLGSTSFVVHIHESALPCDFCVSDGENEIALFPSVASQPRREVIDITNDPEPAPAPPANSKKAMQTLKKQLLSQHSVASAQTIPNETNATSYVDRSAMRRALQTSHAYGGASFSSESVRFESVAAGWPSGSSGWASVNVPSLPGPPPPSTSAFNAAQRVGFSGRYYTPTTENLMQARTASLNEPEGSWPSGNSYRSSALTPISSSNIGHGLLSKLGWKPGTALGVAQPDTAAEDLSKLMEEKFVDVDAVDEVLRRTPERDDGPNARRALVEPLQAKANAGRSGLGLHPTSSSAFPTVPPPMQWKPKNSNRRQAKERMQRNGRQAQPHERSWADIRRELE